MTATFDDLKQAVQQNLETKGTLDVLRAKLRADIYSLLRDPSDPPPQSSMTDENLLINELFKEYLTYNGLSNTLSVFLPETGTTEDPMLSRSLMAKDLNLIEDPNTRKVPLLYSLISTLKSSSDLRTSSEERAIAHKRQPMNEETKSPFPHNGGISSSMGDNAFATDDESSYGDDQPDALIFRNE